MRTDELDENSYLEILQNISRTLGCRREEIRDFRPGPSGMMNRSYCFRVGEGEYLYRRPGPGTNALVNRAHEKQSLRLAGELGLDPTCLYMDGRQGWKISRYVPEFREPDYGSGEDSRRILAVLRRLHAAPFRPDYGLRPWEDALALETQIRREDPEAFLHFEDLKARLAPLAVRAAADGVEPCFCHGDCYKPNWLLLPDGGTILIDWEYAGTSDPGVDLGYYLIDGEMDMPAAERFIREYLGEGFTEALLRHYLTMAALTGYYWCLWALLRRVRGIDNGDAPSRWERMTRTYAEWLSR